LPKITKIQAPSKLPTRKRVAAYARVSVEKEQTLQSLSIQVSHYSKFIQNNPEWEYVGVYADSGQSGTSKSERAEFQRLITDCEAGRIDLVLTKSISRFARNTVDLLDTVRRLKELGVEVRFEEQNINSLSGDGELMLSILASFAQEESRSQSENVKWAIRKGFKQGIPNNKLLFGYRWQGDRFVIHPEEAETVRIIYREYLKGQTNAQIRATLAALGRKTHTGLDKFGHRTIKLILSNEKYTGDLLLQKCYIENHLTHKEIPNRGELPSYLVKDAHEAIISREMFAAAQAETQRRLEATRAEFPDGRLQFVAFSGKLECGRCGAQYHRRTYTQNNGKRGKKWQCYRKCRYGTAGCASHNIGEQLLIDITTRTLGMSKFDEAEFKNRVAKVIANPDLTLTFHLANGKQIDTGAKPKKGSEQSGKQ